MGLPLARALAFGHAMAIAPSSIGRAFPAAQSELTGSSPDDPVAAAIAPYFDPSFYRAAYPDLLASGTAISDTALLQQYCGAGWREGRNPSSTFNSLYYLAANPDVAEAGINPFWHYTVTGKAEGRYGQPPDRYRRTILRDLPLLQKQRSAPPPATVIRLRRARLVEVMTAGVQLRSPSPQPGGPQPGTRGVVVSVSHDSYARFVGGTQILISDEQKRFNALGYSYIHVCPGAPSLFVDRNGPAGDLVELAVDGVSVGMSDYADVAWALSESFSDRPGDRLFTLHCVLGHRVDGVIALQRAVKASRSWFWIHDFSSVCANHTLLRNDVSFCGAPPPNSVACGICVHGDARHRHLRSMEQLFAAIDFHVLAPSQVALDFWRESMPLPTRSTRVIEHCRFVEQGVRTMLEDGSTLGLPGTPVRVAFVGAPTFHKGWGLFEELVTALQGSFSYHIHHFAAPEAFRQLSGVTEVAVTVTAIDRHAMVEALAAHSIDLVLMLTVLPETFSFTTYEALAAGADVVALETSGNVAATISRLGRGRVFNTERDLLGFFTSFTAVEYIRDRLRDGIPVGTLDHCGTTAAVVEQVKA
ncbi:hypothetical protein [Azospirillum largimobile]